MRDIDLVRADQRPNPKVDTFFPVVLRDHVGFFGPMLDLGHIFQPHDRASPIGDDQVFELHGRAQVGIRQQVDLHEVAFRSTDGRQEVVALEGCLHVSGREVERGEAIGVDPDSHGDLTAALEGDPLDTGQRRELGLQRAQQPIRDGRHAALRRGKAEIEGCVGAIGALHFDRRRLSFRRQLGSYLLEPRRDLG